VEPSEYGIYIIVNGKCLAQVDLYYYSKAWKEREIGDEDFLPNPGEDFPQIVIYTGDDSDDVAAHARWRDGQVSIESDHPTAGTRTFYSPGCPIQILTVGEAESREETEGEEHAR
jgi:hypothetical protein